MDWDNPLPDEIIARWERWRTELPLLENVKLNSVKPPGFERPFQAEVHSFSDPRESGIGQVSYLWTVNSKGEVHVSFLMAKSRAAPIKPISFPRMELRAAVVYQSIGTLRTVEAVGRRRDRKWLFQFRMKSACAWRFLPLSRTRPEEIWRRLENVSI